MRKSGVLNALVIAFCLMSAAIDNGYLYLTKLKDGSAGLLFEKDGYKLITFTFFSLDWLTDGNDAGHQCLVGEQDDEH